MASTKWMVAPACRIVVAGPLEPALATISACMASHRYRQTSAAGESSLAFRRGSRARYFLLGFLDLGDLARYSRVTVRPTVLPGGDVHFAIVQVRAHIHSASAPGLRAAVADLVGRFALAGVLRFAGGFSPESQGVHLHTDVADAEGYRGERGPDGAPLAWTP